MQRIETMMDTIVMAFHKQLDALFRDDAMDIASDITVMENLLAQEGSAARVRTKTKKGPVSWQTNSFPNSR